MLKNPHLFSFANSALYKKEEKANIVDFNSDINKHGVFNSIKENVVFDTSKVNYEECDNEDEELFMFYSTKPCSNDVQEKANIEWFSKINPQRYVYFAFFNFYVTALIEKNYSNFNNIAGFINSDLI